MFCGLGEVVLPGSCGYTVEVRLVFRLMLDSTRAALGH